MIKYLLNIFQFSSSEPDVDATLDKLFDEMAFKQNDSKFAAHLISWWFVSKNTLTKGFSISCHIIGVNAIMCVQNWIENLIIF